MRRLALVVPLLLLAAGCGRSTARPRVARIERLAQHATACAALRAGHLDYGWPLEPFAVQHPIRGNFGDPRTISAERFGLDGFGDPGDYSFHNGVDISAKPGTPVYPVVSGIAYRRHVDEVLVRAPGGRDFQYWHIAPEVRAHERVTAFATVLGRVEAPARHVHLTEVDHERVANPADRLRPYADRTVPVVRSLSFSDPAGQPLDPDALHGLVAIVAEADDLPPVPVVGAWNGFPVTPALVRWSLLSTGRKSVVVSRTVADFRRTEPPRQDFWRVYAAGTYQNFPIFQRRYYWRRAGRYLFALTRRPLDTRRLPDGDYTAHVEASDLCGNRGTLDERVRIANRETAP